MLGAFDASHGAAQHQILATVRDTRIREWRHAMLARLSDLRHIPGTKGSARRPGGDLLEFRRDHDADMARFCLRARVWRTNNIDLTGPLSAGIPVGRERPGGGLLNWGVAG